MRLLISSCFVFQIAYSQKLLGGGKNNGDLLKTIIETGTLAMGKASSYVSHASQASGSEPGELFMDIIQSIAQNSKGEGTKFKAIQSVLQNGEVQPLLQRAAGEIGGVVREIGGIPTTQTTYNATTLQQPNMIPPAYHHSVDGFLERRNNGNSPQFIESLKDSAQARSGFLMDGLYSATSRDGIISNYAENGQLSFKGGSNDAAYLDDYNIIVNGVKKTMNSTSVLPSWANCFLSYFKLTGTSHEAEMALRGSDSIFESGDLVAKEIASARFNDNNLFAKLINPRDLSTWSDSFWSFRGVVSESHDAKRFCDLADLDLGGWANGFPCEYYSQSEHYNRHVKITIQNRNVQSIKQIANFLKKKDVKFSNQDDADLFERKFYQILDAPECNYFENLYWNAVRHTLLK